MIPEKTSTPVEVKKKIMVSKRTGNDDDASLAGQPVGARKIERSIRAACTIAQLNIVSKTGSIWLFRLYADGKSSWEREKVDGK